MGTFVVKGPFANNIKYREGYTRADRKNSQGIVSINAWRIQSLIPPTPVTIHVVSFGVFVRFSFPDMGNAPNARDVLTRSISDLRGYVDQKIHRVYGTDASASNRQIDNGMYVSGADLQDKMLIVKAKRARDGVLVAQHVRNFFSYQHHPKINARFEKTQSVGWQTIQRLTEAEENYNADTKIGVEKVDYCAITDTDAVVQFVSQSKLTYTSYIMISSAHVVSGEDPNEFYVQMCHMRISDIPNRHPTKLFQKHIPEIPEYALAATAPPKHTEPEEHASRLRRHLDEYMGCVKWALDQGPSHHPAYDFKHLAPHVPEKFYYSVAPWWPDGTPNPAGVPPCADIVDSY